MHFLMQKIRNKKCSNYSVASLIWWFYASWLVAQILHGIDDQLFKNIIILYSFFVLVLDARLIKLKTIEGGHA